jgi:hypothetical protein
MMVDNLASHRLLVQLARATISPNYLLRFEAHPILVAAAQATRGVEVELANYQAAHQVCLDGNLSGAEREVLLNKRADAVKALADKI